MNMESGPSRHQRPQTFQHPRPPYLAYDERGVTHVIEFTLALTFFIFIIQGFQEGVEFRLSLPMSDDTGRDATLHSLMGHLIRSPGLLDNEGTNDTHWERYPPVSEGANQRDDLAVLGLAVEDEPGTLSRAKVLALRNLSYQNVLNLLELRGIHFQLRVTVAGASSPLLDWGGDHTLGYSGSSLARVVKLEGETGDAAARIQGWLFSGSYPANRIQISEVMYSPPQGYPYREWVELYNPTSMAVDVANWKLSANGDADSFRALGQQGTLVPGQGYALVVTETVSIALLREFYTIPDTTIFLRINDGGLGEAGLRDNETLALFDPGLVEIERVSWGPDGGAVGNNETWERVDSGVRAEAADNWGPSDSGGAGGSPGRRNTIAA